MSLTLHYNMGS